MHHSVRAPYPCVTETNRRVCQGHLSPFFRLSQAHIGQTQTHIEATPLSSLETSFRHTNYKLLYRKNSIKKYYWV
jgi:hypothetical protein